MAEDLSPIRKLRSDLGLTQAEFAERLGISSLGHMSEIERGTVPCSIDVALRIETMSNGAIKAAQLNADVAKIAAHIAGSAA